MSVKLSLFAVLFVSILIPPDALSGNQGSRGSEAYEASEQLRGEAKVGERNEVYVRRFSHFANIGIKMLRLLAKHGYDYYSPDGRLIDPDKLKKTLHTLTRPNGRLETYPILPNGLSYFWDKDRQVLQMSEEAWDRDFETYINTYLAQLSLHQLFLVKGIEDYQYSARVVVDFERLEEELRQENGKEFRYDSVSYHADGSATISHPRIRTHHDGFQPIDGFTHIRDRYEVDVIKEGRGLTSICHELGFYGIRGFDRIIERNTKVAQVMPNSDYKPSFNGYATPRQGGKVARLTHFTCGAGPDVTIGGIQSKLYGARFSESADIYEFDGRGNARFKVPFIEIDGKRLLFLSSPSLSAKSQADGVCRHFWYSESTSAETLPLSDALLRQWGVVEVSEGGGIITQIGLSPARKTMGTHYISEVRCK